jgi:molecular chaperone GrpE (heat shock protein)
LADISSTTANTRRYATGVLHNASNRCSQALVTPGAVAVAAGKGVLILESLEEAKLEFLRYANQSLIEELIPVLDSFNIAITSGHREIEPIYRQVLSVLRARGLEELMPIGNLFNPSAHEAISVEVVNKIEDDQKIIDVLQKGYKLGDKIIRPAKVKIGEFNS